MTLHGEYPEPGKIFFSFYIFVFDSNGEAGVYTNTVFLVQIPEDRTLRSCFFPQSRTSCCLRRNDRPYQIAVCRRETIPGAWNCEHEAGDPALCHNPSWDGHYFEDFGFL